MFVSPASERQERARGASSGANETVPEKPRARRRFTAAEKLRLVKKADACIASGKRGALGAMLREEGIYRSHLSTWRAQLAESGFAGLNPGDTSKLEGVVISSNLFFGNQGADKLYYPLHGGARVGHTVSENRVLDSGGFRTGQTLTSDCKHRRQRSIAGWRLSTSPVTLSGTPDPKRRLGHRGSTVVVRWAPPGPPAPPVR